MQVPARLRPLLGGWRLGIVLNAGCAFVVLAINFGVTVWAYATTSTYAGSRRLLYEGSCSKVRTIDVAGHVVINALSTVLLSASNYCMQCLSAPTRAEVDRAHAKRTWLEIGTPSIRNLRHITSGRVWLWWILCFSSLPLHLFYNSALFSSFGASQYVVVSAVEQFVGNTTIIARASPDTTIRRGLEQRWMESIADELHAKAAAGALQKLNNLECLEAYAQPFQSARSNLVLVISQHPEPPLYDNVLRFDVPRYTLEDSCGARQAFTWVCESIPSPKERCFPCEEQLPEIFRAASADEWTAWGNRVSYCLSEPAPDQCKLFFSPMVAIVVNVMNLVKLVCILLILIAMRDAPILTVGDVVASFMETPDETTRGLGVVGRADFASLKPSRWTNETVPPKGYDGTRKRWLKAVRKSRMIRFVGLYLALLSGLTGLLGWGIRALRGSKNAQALWEIGFGTIDNRTLITGSQQSILSATILANLAQPIISAAYFVYNRMATLMAMAGEWDRFALERKGLRVSKFRPAGVQRSSHFLQLPYRFAAPIMLLSGLLHWMASQSIFVVDVEYHVPPGVDLPTGFATTCGYSPLAILCLICLGLAMILFLVALSMRRFRTGMPVAANCSAAISAACHPGTSFPGVSRLPLQWGEVLVDDERGNVQTSFSFSHELVNLSFPRELVDLPTDASTNRFRVDGGSRTELLAKEKKRVEVAGHVPG